MSIRVFLSAFIRVFLEKFTRRDSYRIVLPNSRITVRVSTLWHQYLDSRDKRAMIEPAIKAPLSFADYVAGRDPALSAVLNVGRR